MSPIQKKIMRKIIPIPPEIAKFQKDVMAAKDEEIPELLSTFDTWTYPKGDLHQWIDVLNKFDAILEVICKKYELSEHIQRVPFAPLEQSLLVSIVKFSVFLVDHCANRGLYASSNNINDLLCTTDIDVLEQVARISLRLAQRTGHQRNGRSQFVLSQEKLWKLADSLKHYNETVSMTDLIGQTKNLKPEWTQLTFPYFRTASGAANTKESASDVSSVEMPNSQNEEKAGGPATIEIPKHVIQDSTLEDTLNKTLETSGLPVEFHFDFMLYLRFSKYVSDPHKIEQLVTIRILALAASSYIVSQNVLQARLLSIEGNVIGQLAKLTHPDYASCQNVMVASLWALEAIAHHRPRLGDVLSALEASVDHGSLMYTLRKTLSDLQTSSSASTAETVEALISLLQYLSTTNVAGSMLCSAGLVQILVDLISNDSVATLRVLVKGLNLLDHLVYGFPQAFQTFCDSHGVSALVNRLAKEVDTDLSNSARFLEENHTKHADYTMSHERFSLLKTMLKFFVHMMQTPGTADGLRNLTETSLLNSMKAIYQNVSIFGSSIFASTTNIMATFINNEPSSYQILHETGLPQLFLSSLKDNGILPATDVLTCMPGIFGAICLNAQGLALFDSLNPIPQFISIFLSHKHCEVLRESDIAGYLGTSMEELVRHQPTLSDNVHKEILNALRQIASLGTNANSVSPHAFAFSLKGLENTNECVTYVDEHDKLRPIIVLHIDIISRFLDGFLQTPIQAETFVRQKGIDLLLDFYSCDTLPYDFATSHAARSLSHPLRIISETSTPAFMQSILARVSRAIDVFLDRTVDFDYPEEETNQSNSLHSSTPLARDLRYALGYITALSDTYFSVLVNTAYRSPQLYQSFLRNREYGDFISKLGTFYRQISREDLKVRRQLPVPWILATQSDEKMMQSEEDARLASIPSDLQSSHKFRYWMTIRYYFCQILVNTMSFFQGLTRSFVAPLRHDHTQREMVLQVSRMVTRMLEENLEACLEKTSYRVDDQTHTLRTVTVTSSLLYNEEAQTEVMTILLVEFQKGVEQLVELAWLTWQDLSHLPEETKIEDGSLPDRSAHSNERIRLTNTMDVLLRTFQILTTKKTVLESASTIALDYKERDKSKAAYFDPKKFLIFLRMRTMPVIIRIWTEASASKTHVPIVEKTTDFLTQSLETFPESFFTTDQIQATSDMQRRMVKSGSSSAVEWGYIETLTPEERNQLITQLKPVYETIFGTAVTVATGMLSLAGEPLVPCMSKLLIAITAVAHNQAEWAIMTVTGLGETLTQMQQQQPQLDIAVVPSFKATSLLLVNLLLNKYFYVHLTGKRGTFLSVLDGLIKYFGSVTNPSDDVLLLLTNLLMASDALLCQQEMLGSVPSGEDASTIAFDNALMNDSVFKITVQALKSARTRTAVLCMLRILVRMTSKFDSARVSTASEALKDVFAAIKSIISECDENMKVTAMLLLRHLIEKPSVLRRIFGMAIEQWFGQKSKIVDVGLYIQQNLSLAIRNEQIFVQASSELCQFPDYDPQKNLQISLRPVKAEEVNLELSQKESKLEPIASPETTVSVEASMTEPFSTPVPFILRYVDQAHKAVVAELQANLITLKNESTPSAETDNSSRIKPEAHVEYRYMCFLLQSLVELLGSYTEAKLDFVRSEISESNSLDSSRPTQPSSNVVLYFFNNLICFDGLDTQSSGKGKPDLNLVQKKKLSLQIWGRRVVVALCEGVPDFASQEHTRIAREVAIDALYTCMKEKLFSSEHTSIRYRHLIALAELADSIVEIPQLTLGTESQMGIEARIHTTRLMLEKNFVALLGQILADIDFQFPEALKLVKSIMRPMKELTREACSLPGLAETFHAKLSRTPDTEVRPSFDASEQQISALSVPDSTPDLYRNSALGLFGAEMHGSDEEEYSSDENTESRYDNMEFADEGSETGSAVSDDDLDEDSMDVDEYGGSADERGESHDVEIILEEHEATSDSEDETGSSDGDTETYSEDIELIGPGDETQWLDGQRSSDHDTNESERARLPNSRHPVFRRMIPPAQMRAMGELSFLLPHRSEHDIDSSLNDDGEDENESDDDDDDDGRDIVAMNPENNFEDLDDEDGDEDEEGAGVSWDWTEIDAGQVQVDERSLASRLWASLDQGVRQSRSRPYDHPDIQIFRRPRSSGILPGSARNPTPVLQNPLLSQEISAQASSNQYSNWIESIEALIGGSAVQLIGDIMRRPGGHGRPQGSGTMIRADLRGNTQNDMSSVEMDRIIRQATASVQNAHGAAREQDLISSISFSPFSSQRRILDEASMIAPQTSEVEKRVLMALLTAMIPRAIEETHARKEELEAQIRKERSRPEKAEAEAKAKAEAEVAGAAREEQHSAIPEVSSMEIDNVSAEAPLEQESSSTVTTGQPGPSGTTPQEPQVIEVGGRTVDISGLGVDVEFLRALPEDLREEVVTQRIREQRANARDAQQQPAPGLAPEFLEALPADIRAELLQQESFNRRESSRQRGEAQTDAGDYSAFLASLDPALRAIILAEQGGVESPQVPLQALPGNNERQLPRALGRMNADSILGRMPMSQFPNLNERTIPIPKPSGLTRTVRLLDIQGIASLLRLFFFPIPVQHDVLHMHNTLLHLTENRSGGTDVLKQMLVLLIEGSHDSSSVERLYHVFTQLARSPPGSGTLKNLKKPQSSNIRLISPSSLTFNCLQTLVFLTERNEPLTAFFLSELEIIRKSAKGKAKSKEVFTKEIRYPINDLISLLGRSAILSNADLLEPLALIISVVSKPLMILEKKEDAPAGSISTTPAVDSVMEESSAQDNTIPTSTDTVARQIQDASAPAKRGLKPPNIPHQSLRLVINLVTADACTGKIFQRALAVMSHFTYINQAHTVFHEELVRQGHSLSSRIEADLEQLYMQITTVPKASQLQRASMAKFTSGNSDQAKFLRILKTVDYLRQTTVVASLRQSGSTHLLFDSTKIWEQLGRCLDIVNEKQDMTGIATLLLPLIEALLVVCKNTLHARTFVNLGDVCPQHREDLWDLFVRFTDQHKKILNQMVRNNPNLMSGSFALLIKNPRVLEFDNKRNYFSRRLRELKLHTPATQLNVRRDAVFLDSYKELHFKRGMEIKYSKLNIRFVGEEGVDAGGVSREWFQILARQMFDPNYALFVPVNADRNTYHPNETSGVNPEHLSFFKFIGRIIGKALYDGRLLDCHFSRPIYCRMLGKKVTLKDMETLDLEYYNSLVWMLNNDITDVISETFSVQRDDFGEITIVDLVEGGRHKAVTEENKRSYVNLVTNYRLLDSVSQQLTEFMAGFNEIVEPDLISIFTEQELELLISGLPDIDPDDWKNNTEYHGYTAASPQVQWFWRAVRSFDDEERARLLQFCTGSSRIPIEGFAHLEGMHGVQRFNIHRDYTTGVRLPQSHTCFNQLDLPVYDNYEILRSSLLTAISEGNEGFGFA